MTTPCALCATPLPDDHPAIVLTAIKEGIKSLGGWEEFEDQFPEGTTVRLSPTLFAVVAQKKITYDTGDLSSEYYSGETFLRQGDTFNTYVVLEAKGHFFRMTGSGDSYGDVTWDGELTQVKAITTTTTIFE